MVHDKWSNGQYTEYFCTIESRHVCYVFFCFLKNLLSLKVKGGFFFFFGEVFSGEVFSVKHF